MKRAFVVLFSINILVFFLSGSAGANLIARDGFEDGYVTAWNTWGFPSPVEPFDRDALFCVVDRESLYDDSFTASRAFATPYVNLDCVVRDVNGRDLSDGALNYHAYFCVADLWENAPNMRRRLNLLEECGLFCDHTGIWVILDSALTEANMAPVPEPGTIFLIGSGLVSAGLFSRMRRRKTKPE